MMLKWLPVIVFAALAGFLAKGLTLDPREVPSPLIDKPAPRVALPVLSSQAEAFDSFEAMAGQVWVLNVFASWCVTCVEEHPVLTELARRTEAPVVGLNYKDTPKDAQAWLGRFGNPFDTLLDDRAGQVGIDWGVYGVPETFVIDRQGIIRFKQIGPVDGATMTEKILPLIDELMAAPA